MSVFNAADLQALGLTFQVAAVTTLVLLLLATPLALWIRSARGPFRILVEAALALPLVLPPTVLGFYLLILMNPEGGLTQALQLVGYQGQLSFSFTGLVLASVIYSLPFAIQPLVHAFEAVPKRVLDAATTLGAGRWDRFYSVILPLSRRGFLTAATLSFAHTVGEFGVVLMVGGNIPGRTQVVSIAIFDHVEALDYTQAHVLSLTMLLFALIVLSAVYAINRRQAAHA